MTYFNDFNIIFESSFKEGEMKKIFSSLVKTFPHLLRTPLTLEMDLRTLESLEKETLWRRYLTDPEMTPQEVLRLHQRRSSLFAALAQYIVCV